MKTIITGLIVALTGLFMLPTAYAAQHIGIVAAVQGVAWGVSEDGAKNKLFTQSKVFENQTIFTEADAKVQLIFNDQSVFTISQNAEIILDEFVYDPVSGDGKSIMEATKGIFKFVTGKIAKKNAENVKINTPFATIGVRGSGGIIQVQPNGQTLLSMTECCLNMAPRGSADVAPVPLTQVGTFSEVKNPDEPASQPKPTPPAVLEKLTGAVDAGTSSTGLGLKNKQASTEKKQPLPTQKDEKNKPIAKKAENSANTPVTRRERLAQMNQRLETQKLEGGTLPSLPNADGGPNGSAAGTFSNIDQPLSLVQNLGAGDGIVDNGVAAQDLINTNEVTQGSEATTPVAYTDIVGIRQVNGATAGNVNAKLFADQNQISIDMGSGVPITRSIPTTAGVLENGVYKSITGEIYVQVGGQFMTFGEFQSKDNVQTTGVGYYDHLPASNAIHPDVVGHLGGKAELVVDYDNDRYVSAKIGFGTQSGVKGAIGGLNRANDATPLFTGALTDVAVYGDTAGDTTDMLTFNTQGVETYSTSSPEATSGESLAVVRAQSGAESMAASTVGVQEGFSAGIMVERTALVETDTRNMLGTALVTNGDNVLLSGLTGDGVTLNAGFGDSSADKTFVNDEVYAAELGSFGHSSGGIDSSDGFLASEYFADVELCTDCDYVHWGAWAVDFEETTALENGSAMGMYVAGDITQNLNNAYYNGLGNVDYSGALAGVVKNGADVTNQTGTFNATVNFSTRELVAWDGNIAGMHLEGALSTPASIATTGDATMSFNLLNNTTVDSGEANGALFGYGAPDIAGNVKATGAGSVAGQELSGIWIGSQ